MLQPAPFIPGESPVPVSGKVLNAADLSFMVDAVLDGWLASGRFTEQFERELAAYVGQRSAVFVNSGSSANLLALRVAALAPAWATCTLIVHGQGSSRRAA